MLNLPVLDDLDFLQNSLSLVPDTAGRLELIRHFGINIFDLTKWNYAPGITVSDAHKTRCMRLMWLVDTLADPQQRFYNEEVALAAVDEAFKLCAPEDPAGFFLQKTLCGKLSEVRERCDVSHAQKLRQKIETLVPQD
jgi:hypothetical protein